MLKHIQKALPLLLLLLLFGSYKLQASHYTGATITYECISANVYRIHHKFYRDCAGVMGSAPTSLTVTGTSGTCTVPTGSGWVFVGSTDVSGLVPSVVTNCNGGTFPGIEEWHYYQDFDFTGVNCTQYKIQWSNCCRAGGITNLVNSGSLGIGVMTDTIHLAMAPCNNSPVWRQPHPRFALTSRINYFDMSATDADGDSLVYSRVQPMESNFTALPYAPNYSLGFPMGPDWFILLDPETGLMQVTPLPGSLEYASMALRVTEYRNGVAIGSVIRDFDIMSLNSLPCANAQPTISGPLNIQNGYDNAGEVVVSPGQTVCFDVTSTDTDPGNVGILSWMRDLPGATLTDTFGGGPDTVTAVGPWARVCWTAPNSFGTDTITITVVDPTCQTNNMVIHKIPVRVGASELVWPGDANNDLIADAFDLLPIGIAFGNSGIPRPSASNTWVGQGAIPWQDTIVGGIDKKFIDCDGSGTINADDTLAITLNYGLTHTKGNLPMARGAGADPTLILDLPDSADVGDTVSAPILLGNNTLPANDVYGYAFEIQYDASLIDSSTFQIDFNNSWVGNSSNSLVLSRNHENSFSCQGAQVRTTHTTVSGMGEVARAHFVIIDNIDGKRQTLDSASLNVFFSNFRLIGLNGEEIAVDVLQDSMVVYDRTTDAAAEPVDPVVGVYPNPAQDVLTVAIAGGDMDALEITTILGQVVLRKTTVDPHKEEVQVSGLANGLYFLRVHTSRGWTLTRIEIR